MTNSILLHHCCVVCSPKVLEYFQKNFPSVVGFWFNPNIYPEDEFARRQNALESYARLLNYRIIYGPEYPLTRWLTEVEKYGTAEPERCRFCYELRLRMTAEAAKENGFKYFSTTLLSSPYQKHELVKEIAESVARTSGREFVYYDFRSQFYTGRNEIAKLGLYRQKYCGCQFSYKDRLKREKNKTGGKQI